jgi:hypothetical protein
VTAAGWLAYGHPAWMVVSLGLCLFALRVGLAIRRARLAHRPSPRGARRPATSASPSPASCSCCSALR